MYPLRSLVANRSPDVQYVSLFVCISACNFISISLSLPFSPTHIYPKLGLRKKSAIGVFSKK